MKRTMLTSCIVLLATRLVLCMDNPSMDERVVYLKLDQKKPPIINVGTRNITTIELPARIEAIEGYGFYLPSEKNAGSPEGNFFQLSYSKGANFFSVRALASGAEGNLTVVINQTVYGVYFRETAEPSFVVVFDDGRGTMEKTESGQGTDPGKPPEQKSASPERLSSLLDKLKGFAALRNSAPEMFEGMTFVEPNKKAKIDQEVSTTILRVLRDDAIDTVGFEVEISNRSKADYYYDPEGFGARVGEKYYGQSISDASGVVPSGRAESIFFCVTGDGKGGRNDLAVSNDFEIAVRKVEGTATKPIGWTEPPDWLPTSRQLGAHKSRSAQKATTGLSTHG
jgi:hypothetical protein